MTVFKPDTCFCVVFIDDTDGNNRRLMRLIHKCRAHNTVNDTMDYNKLPKFRTGTDDKQQVERSKSKSHRDYQRR